MFELEDRKEEGEVVEPINLPPAFRFVPLRKELATHVVRARTGHKMVHHPLVISPFYVPELNGQLNDLFAAKTAALKEAVYKRNWGHAITLHERPYRLDALLRYEPEMRGSQYWLNVSQVWRDSENIFENRDTWRLVLTWPREDTTPINLMSDNEQELYRALPDDAPITIWRGTTDVEAEEGTYGFSWTLSEKTARWFAKRNALLHGGEAVVLVAEVEKQHVIALLIDRNEEEVVTVGPLIVTKRLYNPYI